jgi:hypothetical protein
MIDWSRCPDVESKPDVMSGAFVVRGTCPLQRVPVDFRTRVTARWIAVLGYVGHISSCWQQLSGLGAVRLSLLGASGQHLHID